jgi:hypothetical protein
MRSSSEKARPAHRAAWFIILAALFLALLSGSLADRGADKPIVSVQGQAQQIEAHAEKVAAQVHPRTYHAEETSHRAGAIGFWILFSLWAVLLAAGLAPRLVQAVRRAGEQELSSGRLTFR